MLLTEMAFQDIPKDLDVQRMRGIPRGMDNLELHPHRLRYGEVLGLCIHASLLTR